jgi:hypothetical protein
MIPTFITEVTSAETGRARAVAGKPPDQKALAEGSQPTEAAVLAPHRPKAQVIVHGVPGHEQGHEVEHRERDGTESEDAVARDPAADPSNTPLDYGCGCVGQLIRLRVLTSATPASYDSCQRNKHSKLKSHGAWPAESTGQ